MKPADPDTFIESVAAVMSDYPLGLVQECADPRSGVARNHKFLSIAELVEWLNERLEHHRALSNWKPRAAALPAPVYSEEHKATMRQKFSQLLKQLGKADPIGDLKRAWRNQQAGA